MVNPTTQQVVFCYMRGETDGGVVVESRYYYDENGKCIETKSNSDETDGGFYDKRAAKDLQAIFRELTKDE